MATRSTRQESQEIKAELEIRHPNRQICIVERSEERRIGKAAAVAQNLEIIEDDDYIVIAKVTWFDILEARKCSSCKSEYLTAAIGEDDPLGECRDCRKARKVRYEAGSQERATASLAMVKAHEAFDEHEEPGY